MSLVGHNQLPRDRHGDQRPVIDGHLKPAILRRSTVRVVCIIWLSLVVYGTLGPLGGGGTPWLTSADTWHWFPPQQTLDRRDVFTNTLVYIPVGLALALLVRRRGGMRSLELLLAMFLAVTVSYVTELLQQFMPARCSSQIDLYVNAGAALFGCISAPGVQRLARCCHERVFSRWHTHPWLAAAWVATGLTFVLMTIPWDLTWPRIETQWDRDFDLLDFRRCATFGLLGFVITMAMVERLGPSSRAVGEAIKRIFVCGVLFEAVQSFVASHACGLLDIGTALLGGMAGCGVARWLLGLNLGGGALPSAARRTLASLGLVGLVTFTLFVGLSRTTPTAPNAYSPRVLWLPFQVQFLKPFDSAVTDVAESLFLYGSLTMLCLYLMHGRGYRLALLLLLGLVGVVQTTQAHFLQGSADLTPLLLAVAAWLLTVRCWRAFVPRPYHPPLEL